jgi:hypothetical protein
MVVAGEKCMLSACRNIFSLIELANRSRERDPPITEKEVWNLSPLSRAHFGEKIKFYFLISGAWTVKPFYGRNLRIYVIG